MKNCIDWLIYLLRVILFLIYTPLIFLTLFVTITFFLIGIPIMVLVFIRDFFPNDGELTQFGFVFSWYDLIVYVPGVLIFLIIMKNIIIPIVWFIAKKYTEFPRR